MKGRVQASIVVVISALVIGACASPPAQPKPSAAQACKDFHNWLADVQANLPSQTGSQKMISAKYSNVLAAGVTVAPTGTNLNQQRSQLQSDLNSAAAANTQGIEEASLLLAQSEAQLVQSDCSALTSAS
jgi:hypothetical protein